jgi:hypothetical protein
MEEVKKYADRMGKKQSPHRDKEILILYGW